MEETRRFVLKQLETMTQDEFRASLVSAGILRPDGRLTSQYAPKKRKPAK